MMQLIGVIFLMIFIGTYLYVSKYKNKEKPKAGIKRDKLTDYLKDYADLKLYWTSISFIIIGVALLVAILIIELSMD